MTFFILGSHPELSTAEIGAVLGRDDLFSLSKEILLVPEVGENLDQLGEKLAGIIKIGRIIGEMEAWSFDNAADLIAAYASQAAGKDKISFGVSVYNGGNESLAKELKKFSQKIGLEAKKRLKEFGRPVRLVTSKDETLSAVVVTKNGLLASGGEFVIIPTKEKVLIGQTEAVQDFESWSERDYGRPRRDAKSGMLPPKLARMMINLAKADPSSAVLLDPFCGSGTVLMEASMLSFKQIVGSDISEKAMADSERNMKWLVRTFNLPDPDVSLFTSPAEKLREQFTDTVDVIVTETYLGPPRSGNETPEQLEIILKDLLKIYIPAFTSLFKLLKPGGTAVVAFPAYVQGNHRIHVPELHAKLKTIGFSLTGRFLYARKGQYVARDILILRKS